MLTESALLHCFNRFVTPEKNYGHVDWSDIDHNLHSNWVWDQDEFNINHIGHPYQGSAYFTTARSAGLNFWESAVYTTVFGNIPWEIFCEPETPAINDIIITTEAGLPLEKCCTGSMPMPGIAPISDGSVILWHLWRE